MIDEAEVTPETQQTKPKGIDQPLRVGGDTGPEAEHVGSALEAGRDNPAAERLTRCAQRGLPSRLPFQGPGGWALSSERPGRLTGGGTSFESPRVVIRDAWSSMSCRTTPLPIGRL